MIGKRDNSHQCFPFPSDTTLSRKNTQNNKNSAPHPHDRVHHVGGSRPSAAHLRQTRRRASAPTSLITPTPITLRRLPETPLRRARRPRTSTSRTSTKRTSRTVDRADVDHADIPYRQPRGRQTRKKGYRSSGIFMQPCNNQLAHEGRVVTATSLGLRRYNKEDDRIIIIIL